MEESIICLNCGEETDEGGTDLKAGRNPNHIECWNCKKMMEVRVCFDVELVEEKVI